jgi:hypothetical protein
MKLQIDKFLTLTAMMATAQLSALACTTDTSSSGQNVGADDAGADDDQSASDDDMASDDDNGSADDDVANEGGDAGADDVAAEGGDAGADDVAAEGGDAGADDVAAEADAGADTADAGTEGGEVFGDAGTEGAAMADAGGEALPPAGDAGAEGAAECLGGTDPAMEAFDCYYMFSACPDSYGATQCDDVTATRRASVYGAFIDCVNAAALDDPCTEAGDIAVADCAAQADAAACVDFDDCATMAASCSEIDVDGCNATLAPFHGSKRDEVTYCFDSAYTYWSEDQMLGPDYEGCGYDFEACLAPSAE